MKKNLLLLCFVTITFTSFCQVLNTGQTLKKGNLSLGVAPGIITNGNTDFILWGHAGYGLTNGVDIGTRIGVLGPGSTYIGADVEFAIQKYFSISAGAHSWGDFGLDGTLLGTINLKKGAYLYGGADLDIDFGNNDVYFPLWIPIGVEVMLKDKMSFLLETCIGLTNPAPHLINGGLNFYF